MYLIKSSYFNLISLGKVIEYGHLQDYHCFRGKSLGSSTKMFLKSYSHRQMQKEIFGEKGLS